MDETILIMSGEQHNAVSGISLHTLENYSTELFSDEDLTEMLTIKNSSYPTHGPTETMFDNMSNLRGHFFMENAEEMLLPWKNNPNFVPIVLTHVITFVIGLVGNIVVISTMSRGHGERSVTSMFLVSLAVADLLLVAVCAPLETMGYFNPWTKGGRLCQFLGYVEMLSAVASVLNLTAVSLERYLVIVYPMKSRSFCTLHNCRRALIAVWIFALLLTAPVIVTKDSVTYVYYNNKTSVTIHYCMDTVDIGQGQGLGAYSSFVIALYQLLIMLVIPLLLMIICYSRVIQELWLSTKQITAMTRECSTHHSPRGRGVHEAQPGWGSSPGVNTITGRLSRSPHQHQHQQHHHGIKQANKCSHSRSGDGAKAARKQVIKMLILVVVLFLVCWGPRLLLNTIIKWGLKNFSPAIYQLRFIFNLLPFVHSCINPVIYGFMSTNFRRMMVRCCTRRRRFSQIFCCFVCCCHDDDAHNARPNSVMFEMSNGVGLRRHTSAYCVSIATTEATLATAAARNSLYQQERPGLFDTDDI